MNRDTKNRLNELKDLAKFNMAKKELLRDLRENNGVELGDYDLVEFIDTKLIHKTAYNRISNDDVKVVKFRYTIKEDVQSKVDSLFCDFDLVLTNKVVFFPSTYKIKFARPSRMYVNFPIAFRRSLAECKSIIDVLLHQFYADIFIVSEDFKFGILIYEDEYEYVFIHHWSEG